MKQLLRAATALFLIVGLTGFCSGGGFANLESVLGYGKIGSNNDYWLEKQSSFQSKRWDKVAVVFGMDDAKACDAIVRALYASYQENWRCEQAN